MRGEKGENLNPQQTTKAADKLNRPCLLPVVSTIDGCQDPAKLYLAGRRTGQPSYLLESAEGPGEAARYSIMGTNPILYVRIKGGEYRIDGRRDLIEATSGKIRGKKDALEILKDVMMLKDMSVPAVASRYMLGVVGYIGYDYVRSLVDVGSHPADDLNQPETEFMLPERMIIFDHVGRRTHYCSLMLLLDGCDVQEEYGRARSNLKELAGLEEINPRADGGPTIRMRSNVAKSKFEHQVERVKRYIRAGDVIQTVLSRRIELAPAPPLGRFYLNLRRINPSPYMFFLDFPERSIVGSSPEILVRVEGRRVVTRPIAGTRRLGKNKADEAAMERELLSDEKERAEHVMLVDLGRNDLGRVSKFGSVEVTDFMKVEKYSHVQHLVTNVVGEMREDRDAFDAFRATFPAGTVTGAPKVRAMEIIDELEPTRRGIYAGAVGSFSYTGDADLAITIRTLVAERGKGYVQVGAGVVADSVPWKEYYETENKARALLRAAGV
jgi:anthranilate synthase component 1